MSLRKQLVKLAHELPELRKYLVPVLRKEAMSFEDFVERHYGYEVPNPNPETRDKYPKVKTETILRGTDPHSQQLRSKMHEEYIRQRQQLQENKERLESLGGKPLPWDPRIDKEPGRRRNLDPGRKPLGDFDFGKRDPRIDKEPH